MPLFGTWMTECFDLNCRRCPRLAEFLQTVRAANPGYHGRPVPPFGDAAPRLLIVGLAPGMHGANRTGRPFTGDHAGILLYRMLHELGFSNQPHSAQLGDGLRLNGVRITNAVKCLPPANKPLPAEERECYSYLRAELTQLSGVRTILALGRVAHENVLRAVALKSKLAPFAHGAEHVLPGGRQLLDSFHCSRYNTQTRRLTEDMFRKVMQRAGVLAGLDVGLAA